MNEISRRKIPGLSAATLIVGPALALNGRFAIAADMPRDVAEDAQARALSYVNEPAKAGANCAVPVVYL